MNLYTYYAIFFILILFGLVSTVMIGFSRRNAEGDQTYFQKTGTKWARLTALYVVSIAAGLLALGAFMYYAVK
ncbi:hypothetical protein ABE504_21510 [Paenibacillus oryzisoli]|uniref:hypothetical protein n=1 Tax=Paenibacillus oryzisoli TaxID=1850517 RepID=UPI003D2772EE